MAQGEEPPYRPRRPPQPYAENAIDADDIGRQNYGGCQNPTPARSWVSNSGQPVHSAPPPGQSGNPGDTGFGSVGGRENVNLYGGPTVSTFGGPRDGPRSFGGPPEDSMHPPVAAPVPQTNGRPPFMAQSSGNSRFSNPPPPRNRFQDQPRSHQAPGSISRAQEPRRVNPRQYDIVSDLNNLFRNAEYYDEEEPAFQLLNGHWLRGVTREAYDELLFEDQVTIRPHLRGRYLLSTGMSQDEVDVAVEMEMAGEDELDIEARINSMRAGEEW